MRDGGVSLSSLLLCALCVSVFRFLLFSGNPGDKKKERIETPRHREHREEKKERIETQRHREHREEKKGEVVLPAVPVGQKARGRRSDPR
jgi:hypothetical protein